MESGTQIPPSDAISDTRPLIWRDTQSDNRAEIPYRLLVGLDAQSADSSTSGLSILLGGSRRTSERALHVFVEAFSAVIPLPDAVEIIDWSAVRTQVLREAMRHPKATPVGFCVIGYKSIDNISVAIQNTLPIAGESATLLHLGRDDRGQRRLANLFMRQNLSGQFAEMQLERGEKPQRTAATELEPKPAFGDSSEARELWDTRSSSNSFPVSGGSTEIWSLPSKPLRVRLSSAVVSALREALHPQVSGDGRGGCLGGLLLGKCLLQSDEIQIHGHLNLEWDQTRGGAPFQTDAQRQALAAKVSSYSGDGAIVGFYRGSRPFESQTPGADPPQRTQLQSLFHADEQLLAACCPLPSASIGVRFESSNSIPRVVALWNDGNVYELTPQSTGMVGLVRDLDRPSRTRVASGPERITLPDRAVPELPSGTSGIEEYPRTGSGRALQRIGWALATVTLSMATYVGAHVYVKPWILKNASGRVQQDTVQPALGAPTAPMAFGLKLALQGSTLHLSWNPHASALQSGKSARIVISDGGILRQIPLDANQLSQGSVMYIPISGDVEFRFEMTDTDSHTVSESVRFSNRKSASSRSQGLPDQLYGDPGGLDGNSQPGIALTSRFDPYVKPLSSGTHRSQARAEKGQTPASPTSIPMSTVAAATAVDTNSGQASNANSLRAVLPPRQAPEIRVGSQITSDVMKDSVSESLPRPLPPDKFAGKSPSPAAVGIGNSSVSSAQAASQPAAHPLGPRGTQLAKVVYQYIPKVNRNSAPPLFADLLVSVIVKLDKFGTPVLVSLVPSKNAPPFFTALAMDAARQSRFSPALVDGAPVESEIEMRFVFVRSR